MNTFNYNISQTEYLHFKTQPNCFELYSGHEAGGQPQKLASHKGGKWVFDDFNQKRLFFTLFDLYRNEFFKAFKSYQRSLMEKPALYEFKCVRRRFSIKVTKLKRGWSNWFVDMFYPSR
jgi:hypothetical protein